MSFQRIIELLCEVARALNDKDDLENWNKLNICINELFGVRDKILHEVEHMRNMINNK